MEFKTKAALAKWANDQTMPEIAAYYNRLPGVKPVMKFESRDVAVTRIWAVLSPDKPQVARKPKAVAVQMGVGGCVPVNFSSGLLGAWLREGICSTMSKEHASGSICEANPSLEARSIPPKSEVLAKTTTFDDPVSEPQHASASDKLYGARLRH
jgi:hypothetical protein